MERPADHRQLMRAAIGREGEAQRALLDDEQRAAAEAFAAAAELYRQSWDAAPPESFGRLVGMLKSAILAGGGEAEARYVRSELGKEEDASPTASYALAIAALIVGDDDGAKRFTVRMRAGSEAFGRTADGIAALLDGDDEEFGRALREIVADFENRDHFLTKVPVADTALMLERLAERRGMSADIESPLLPG